MIGNDLCNYFVNDITKGDWSELFWVSGSLLLGDESDESFI